MVRTSLFASLLAVAALTLAGGANANAAGKKHVVGAYTFEFHHGEDTSEFDRAVAGLGETRFDFDEEIFRGRSIQFDDPHTAKKMLAELAAMPVVKSVHPVRRMHLPKPKLNWVAGTDLEQAAHLNRRAEGQQPDLYSTHVMTQVDKLRAKGITGRGVKLAVIDTGIDYLHPALGGCFGKGCLVSFGEALVDDSFNGTNKPVPGKSVMDCQDHGTHVSGIIAAQKNSFNFTGIAPDVELGMYRVFGCDGGSSDDVLMSAFIKAWKSGAQVISASVGGGQNWSRSPNAVIVSRLAERGVICVIAAGNSGGYGLFTTESPSTSLNAPAVASFNNIDIPSVWALSTYQIDAGPEQQFSYQQSTKNDWDDSTAFPLWADSFNLTSENDGCGPLPANTPDLSKYIVILRRGTCYSWEKANHAIAKGAKYILFYTNQQPVTEPNLAKVNGTLKAAGMITAQVGETLIKALQAGKRVNMHMVGGAKSIKYATSDKDVKSGGALSSFTSWGPTYDMYTKPQFGAVGGNVLSTLPRAHGYYGVMSGTSMACPQVAGIVALILQVRGRMDFQAMTELLSANANPQVFNDGQKFSDYLAPVPQQGGGLVQAYDAAYATTLLSPSGLSFNDTEHFAKQLSFTLQNTNAKSVTYNISHFPAATVNTFNKTTLRTPLFPGDLTRASASATLKFSETSVTLRGGENKTITVSATAPEGLDASLLPVWSGYIAVNGTDGASLSLPYQGMTGSMRQQRVLNLAYITRTNKTAEGFPLPVAANTTFLLPEPGTAEDADGLPFALTMMTFGSPLVRAYVIPVDWDPKDALSTTKIMGLKTIGETFSSPVTWISRTTEHPLGFEWDGRLLKGTYAPPGKYKILVRALRVFGDEKNEADWDSSTTSAFSIKYQ
ncbi:hypothetical protein E4U53_007837 [Claviceps sorghi]|nr:hypothetical protein E4U53_007837 [Claviceps sorghi]